jgi:hypothetical protein
VAEPTTHVLDVPLGVLADDVRANESGVFDDESMTFITQTYQSAHAFLFGRPTYEASA